VLTKGVTAEGAERKIVLVTRARIAPSAVALLNDAGFDVVFSPPYDPPEVVAKSAAARGVHAIMVSQGKITDAVIGASPRLDVIVKHGSGVNNIDLRAAERRGIPVYRTVGANALSVAEHAVTLAMALCKQLPFLDSSTKSGNWLKSGFVGKDLRDTVLGLVGFGAIAREVARLARGLGMRIVAYDPYAKAQEGVDFVADLDSLLVKADVVSLHCPLTPETRNLFDADRLARMKPTACLVNTARGGIVDEAALDAALRAGVIAGAALDSFAIEPPDVAASLWSAPNLIVTPHVAGVTAGAEVAMAEGAARHIIDHFAGRTVDPASRVTAEVHGGLQQPSV
jgi:D-3-phosphoglycerate dehydrogenase